MTKIPAAIHIEAGKELNAFPFKGNIRIKTIPVRMKRIPDVVCQWLNINLIFIIQYPNQ